MKRLNPSRLPGIAALACGGLLLAVSGFALQGSEAQRPPRLDDSEAVRDRLVALERVVLPEVQFSDLPLKDAVAELEGWSARSEAGGLRIAPSAELSGEARINLRLMEVPWTEALRYVSALASARPVVEDGGIALVPADRETEWTTEAIPLDEAGARFVAASRAGGLTVHQALELAGVEMPRGSSAIYNPAAAKLIVRHHAEGLRQVKRWLLQGKEP